MKKISTHAAAAKAIRQELKESFPLTKFNVTSSVYSGGNSVHIEWSNGPTDKNVSEIISKYQYGNFDSMRDLYEYTNCIEGLPQVKYVQTRREVSEDIQQSVFERAKTFYNGWENLKSIDESSVELLEQWSFWTAREYIHRMLSKIDLTTFNISSVFNN